MFRAIVNKQTALLAIAFATFGLVGCSDDDDNNLSSTLSDEAVAPAQVRAIHAVPDAPPVNIVLNGAIAVAGLDYSENSGFAELSPGNYVIDVDAITPDGTATVIPGDLAGAVLSAGSKTTVFAVGSVDASDDADIEKTLTGLVVSEPVNQPTSEEVNLKVLHAAPAAEDVDIFITGFGADISALTPITAGFLDSAEIAAPVPAVGAYQVQITAVGDPDTVVYDSGSLDLSSFAGQSLIVAALNTTTQARQAASPVKLLAVNDTTELELLDVNTQAGAKVVHLSPDASDDAGGPVEVFANGALELIPAFSYGDIVAAADNYTSVPSGDYVFTVSPDDNTNDDVVYTSPSLNLAPGSETSVLAVGYVTPPVDGPAFELITSADSNRAYGTHARIKVIHGAAAVGNVDVYVTEAGTLNSINVTTLASPVLSGVPFKGDSGYIDISAGTYDVFIAAAGTDTVAIEVTDVELTNGDVYSLVARGADESADATLLMATLVVLTN